jgi:predicted MFS family arabinose efflux permease
MSEPKNLFTRYQAFIITMIAILHFTIILDFMVLSPLGAQLIRIMNIKTSQFGLVVSSYAFSAGISGFLAAGFADKFDRKKLLLFFYAGFILGTFICGLAPTFHILLFARIITGIFGGVIGSISFAIITDLFPIERRGRVMGFVQMAFAASQVMGIPIGLYLASIFDWHAPFLLIASLSVVMFFIMLKFMRPVNEHLKTQHDTHPLHHLLTTVSKPIYIRAFFTTTLLATGGFMLMPFSSTFLVNNVGITEAKLPVIFMVTGIFSIITGPLIGKLSDKVGKYKLFIAGSILSTAMVIIYTNLGVSPIWEVILINSILFMGISSRMISSSALMTAVPELHDRGSFMGVNSSVQQLAGGLASAISGLIVMQETPTSPVQQFNTVGYIVVGSMFCCVLLMFGINKYVKNKYAKTVASNIPVVEHV